MDHVSECSHRVTTQRAIKVEQRGERSFAVDAMPADCTRVALLHILPSLGITADASNTWVYSGINEGGNLGADIYISGTVAAVREAAFHSLPGVAFSHYRRGRRGPEAINWPRAIRWTRRVLEALRDRQLLPGAFWNVNFPCIDGEEDPQIIFCERSRHPLPVKYDHTPDGLTYIHSRYHQRTREPGSDVDVCFGGNIAVSMVHL
jgi:5'-nucleotidase